MNKPALIVVIALLLAAALWPIAALAYDGAEAASEAPGRVEVLLAYIDPGAGGFIIVTVLGFISAIGYMARSYLARVKELVFKRGGGGGGNARPASGADGGEDEC